MISKDYVILAPEGIHARPATALIRITKKFRSTFTIRKNNHAVKLNSIVNLLSMGAKGGDTISILVEGDDETEAAAALDVFFKEQIKGM